MKKWGFSNCIRRMNCVQLSHVITVMMIQLCNPIWVISLCTVLVFVDDCTSSSRKAKTSSHLSTTRHHKNRSSRVMLKVTKLNEHLCEAVQVTLQHKKMEKVEHKAPTWLWCDQGQCSVHKILAIWVKWTGVWNYVLAKMGVESNGIRTWSEDGLGKFSWRMKIAQR